MRLYRALLLAYPASFRAEYGEEMSAIFRRRRLDARGPVAIAGVVAEYRRRSTLANAAAVHWDILRQDLQIHRANADPQPRFRAYHRDPRRDWRRGEHRRVLGHGFRAGAAAAVPGQRPSRARLATRPRRLRTDGVLAGQLPRLAPDEQLVRAAGAFFSWEANLVGRTEPERVDIAMVTADLLPDARRSPGDRPILRGNGRA